MVENGLNSLKTIPRETGRQKKTFGKKVNLSLRTARHMITPTADKHWKLETESDQLADSGETRRGRPR